MADRCIHANFTFNWYIFFWIHDWYSMNEISLQVLLKLCTIFADNWWNGQWFCEESIKSKHSTLFPKWVIFCDQTCKCKIISEQISKIHNFSEISKIMKANFKICQDWKQGHFRWGLRDGPSHFPFLWKMSALLPFDSAWMPSYTRKCEPAKKIKKIKPIKLILLKLTSRIKITGHVECGNSKLGPKAIKLALHFSFYLKIKNKSVWLGDWYGRDDRTSIQYLVSFQ